YGVAFLAKMAGLPMIACLLLGPLLGCLGAAVFGFFAVQLTGVYFAMLTLAFAQIVWSIAFQWVEVTGGDNGILGVWPEKWAASPARFYWLSLGLAALVVAGLRVMVFSPFGYALRATRDSLLRSEAVGINAKRIQWTAFVVAGTVAGIAGALFAYLKGSVFPDTLGISLSVDALVMVLLGGIETVMGPLVGAMVYKALNIWLISQTDLSKLVLGGFIVLIVVAFPKGIVGVLETLRHRHHGAAPKPAILTSSIESAE
ncbi:MAG TPA: branched-chain amino acid ABC transporter permease, partial [Bradyrhizobium sp.]